MDIDQYILHLISTPTPNSCVRAGEVMEANHDQVNRLLAGSSFSGKDLYDRAVPSLVCQGGTLTADDTVIDKPYSKLEANELVGNFWSGKHHRPVRGISLVVLVYTDVNAHSLPVNFRLYDPRDDRSKHDLLQEMLGEVLDWGLRPARFTADSWYSSLDTLKWLRDHKLGFQIGVKSDRSVSTQAGVHERVGSIEDIPDDGLWTHLKKFDFVKLFRTVAPDGSVRHYIVYEPDKQALQNYDRQAFKQSKLEHWNVEDLFRMLKQTCQLERFFVRKAQAVSTHVYAALRASQQLCDWCKNKLFSSAYAVKKSIFLKAQQQFIQQMTA